MATYRVSPAWRISAVGDGFEIHGGDDARYELDASWLAARLAADRAVARDEVPTTESGQFEQLRAAGVIGPVLQRRSGRVSLFGDDLPSGVRGQLTCDVTDDEADLVVVVRHRSTHRAIFERVLEVELDRVHLYADISFHHTVSLGPLVIPHETPCIGCLLGRVRERWGDHQPAPEPAVVTDFGPLVAALVSTEVERCLDGDTSLVGRTVAWDLQQRRVISERLLTVPVCPYCSDFDNPGVIPG